jgi:hypothetical protein
MPGDVDPRKLYDMYFDAFKNELKLNKRDNKLWQELNAVSEPILKFSRLNLYRIKFHDRTKT